MRRVVASVLAVGLAAGACGDGSGSASSAPKGADPLSGTVTVLAAASLTEALEEVATEFEAQHGRVEVALSFGGSSSLAAAVVEGAPADVFAAADDATLHEVTDAGRTSGAPVVIATNSLQIVVAKGNPLGISGLDDLAGELVVSLCRAEVPCGSYASRAFERAGLPVPPAGREDSVRGVLTKVQLGEADAGVVYRTDVLAAEDVEGIDLPTDQQVRAAYPATVLSDAPNPAAAAAFVAFLTSADGQAILARFGFGPP